VAGSPNALINIRTAVRVGGSIDCGGNDSTGSPDTLIGGASPPGMTRSPFAEECEDKASKER
jgi:hypothetical protein